MGYKERRPLLIVHADSHAIASDPGLGDFKESRTNFVAIADTGFVVGKADDRKIFAELTVDWSLRFSSRCQYS
jgi:hypothetical protein